MNPSIIWSHLQKESEVLYFPLIEKLSEDVWSILTLNYSCNFYLCLPISYSNMNLNYYGQFFCIHFYYVDATKTLIKVTLSQMILLLSIEVKKFGTFNFECFFFLISLNIINSDFSQWYLQNSMRSSSTYWLKISKK